jgi:hypothetical protein
MSYLGVPPFGQTVRTITESLATAGQTTFSPSGGYLPGYIDVFLNGSALGAADFTATNGSTVVLNVAAALNDEFKAIAYWPVSLIDTYRKAEADALLAARVGTTSSVSMRNRIINGDMRIDQRNAGASVTPIALEYQIDRWRYFGSQASRITMGQNQGGVTPPAGFTNYLGVTSSSAYTLLASDFFGYQQFVEGFNVADLGWGTANAQPVTVSFWVRSSLTGMFGGSIQNSATNRSHPFSYTIAAANTWEYKTVTIPGDTSGAWLTNNGRGLGLNFMFGVGSNNSGTAGAWTSSDHRSVTGAVSVVGVNGATFYITGVQLEAGSVASPFERRAYGQELALCQRYYHTNETTSYVAQSTAYNAYVFPQKMRATPTLTLTPTAGSVNPGTTGAAGFNSIGTTSAVGVTVVASAEL